IDTAEVYGRGRSEELVARAISGRRDGVRIATKGAPQPDGSGFRAAQVRSACEGSLRRLGTDHVDLYQLHWPDERGVPIEETWGEMVALLDDGLVRSIGVSNFARALIERCEAIRHVDSLQQEVSMLRLDDRELIRVCGEQGPGVLSSRPLAYALLTGAIRSETRFDEGDFRGGEEEGGSLFAPGNRERNLAVVHGLRPIGEATGT